MRTARRRCTRRRLDDLKGCPDGRLILVTAISPTQAGEGKTTTTIGLSDALNRIGRRTVTCLRERDRISNALARNIGHFLMNGEFHGQARAGHLTGSTRLSSRSRWFDCRAR
jgi:hypothetical protein